VTQHTATQHNTPQHTATQYNPTQVCDQSEKLNMGFGKNCANFRTKQQTFGRETTARHICIETLIRCLKTIQPPLYALHKTGAERQHVLFAFKSIEPRQLRQKLLSAAFPMSFEATLFGHEFSP
jgi:hypothetical protein